MRNPKLLWSIILLLAIAVVGLGRLAMSRNADPVSASPEAKEEAVAVIGGKEIPAGELQKSLYQKYGRGLLSQMLDRQAVQMEADETGIRVTEDEIAQELKRMQQGYDSEEQFYQTMTDQVGLSRAELHEDVYYKLLTDKIATRTIQVTDGEVEDYIKTHPEEFKVTVQLRIAQIITDTREQANRTFELAVGGEDFGMLARERSLDTNTANEGGDLGWVEENDPFVPAPILKSALKLKVGEVSKPLPLDKGYAVIRLEDRREQSKGTPEEIREMVRKQLALQKAPPTKDLVAALRDKRKASILDPALQAPEGPNPPDTSDTQKKVN